MTKKKSGDRTLTPEDEGEWQKEAQLARPLQSRPRQIAENKKQAHTILRDQPIRADRPVAAEKLPPLSLGSYVGVDKNTRERFRKGNVPLDGRLDLHGDTRETARRRVENFIHQHYSAGSRALLIITGKGNYGKGPESQHSGVLRESLPAWLCQEELRPFILAFDRAAVKDGGSGAVYVLLKRRRE